LSAPRQLFDSAHAYAASVTIANYDVTYDNLRFIMIKDECRANQLNVVLNWFGELNRQAR